MASVLKSRANQRRQVIKQDPEWQLPNSTYITSDIQSQAASPSRNGRRPTVSNSGDYASHLDIDQSFYQRSNAPPPPSMQGSERPSESDVPLFKEVRSRPITTGEVPPTPNESFFHTSFQAIGKKLKACNDTLGELQQLGVSHDVQLPELVLVGDQSAGKSSVMSGLANLDLPRSEGTCTRCPLHIRVSRNSDWSCRVWLRKEYTYQPPPNQRIHENDVTEQDPFFPWKKLVAPDICEFKTMRDKSEIEDVLRWAQIAILNDDKHHELFVPGSGAIATNPSLSNESAETVAKFSPNVVALEIKGPELPDLSFYDMPGMFQSPADADDNYLVNVVRNLSQAYIQHPSAIIMCSMPMNYDAENSFTFGLIRRLGASQRTIGVLTKADLLPEGSDHSSWLSIMKGQAHTTGLGYFITSRPQNKDLEQLKVFEEMMFESHNVGLWPDEFQEFKHRCGVEKLKAFISERLGEEFAKSLPNIKQNLKGHRDKIKKQLASLPELPDNAEHEIKNSLRTFADSARYKMDSFVRSFDSLPRSFRDCLLNMKPKFVLRDISEQRIVQEISDDESDTQSIAGNNSTRKRRTTMQQTTPSKRPRGETQAPQTPGTSFHTPARPNRHMKFEDTPGSGAYGAVAPTPQLRILMPAPFTEFSDIGRGFRTLRQVQEEICLKTRAGVPDLISVEVYEDLVKEAVKPWNKPMRVFLNRTMRELQAELDNTLSESLDRLKKRCIYKEAREHLKTCLKEYRAATEEALSLAYRDETERLFTFNEEALKQYKDDEREVLRRFRHHMRMQASGRAPREPMPSWESLTEEQRTSEAKRQENERAQLGPDPFEREVDVITYVRGYYRLAALRFADTVSQRIICRMIPEIRRQLPGYIEDRLGVNGPDTVEVYSWLMEEDEATAKRRDMLKTEKAKFEQALASIGSLEIGAAVATGSRSDLDESSIQYSGEGDSQVTVENGLHVEEV